MRFRNWMLAAVLLGGSGAESSQAQDPAPAEPPKPDPSKHEAVPPTTTTSKKPQTWQRKTDLVVTNSVRGVGFNNEIFGGPALELKLDVREEGIWNHARETHILVAVYERPDMQRIKVGKILALYTHPTPVITDANLEKTTPITIQIPMPPGEYVYRVFATDGKKPYRLIAHEKTFPDPKNFPGELTRAISGVAHIK